jgi:hypothetical protein
MRPVLAMVAPSPDGRWMALGWMPLRGAGRWAEWLDPANDMAASFRGSPAGSLNVEPIIEPASA